MIEIIILKTMQNKKQLFNFLDSLNIEYKVFDHPPVYTVDEAAHLANHVPGAACKNLFLKDSKKRLWLIVACADTKIELKKLSKELAAPELRFASPELLIAHLGVLPGSVTPFGLINNNAHDITIVFDSNLQKHTFVGFHPLENNATVVLHPNDLLKFIEAHGNPIVFVNIAN